MNEMKGNMDRYRYKCRCIKEDAEVILKKKKKNEKKERKKKKMQRLRKGNRESEMEIGILNFLSPCSEQCHVIYLYMNISLNCLDYSLIYRNYTLHTIKYHF